LVIVWNMIKKLFVNNNIKYLIFICLLQTTPVSIKNHNLDRKIVKWMALKYLPFNFFDDEETQEFFSILNPILSMPKRTTTLRTKIVQVFTEIQKFVIDILKENKSKISFTLDGWTSIAGKSYYGITAHFISDNWKLVSVALDFIASNGHHTGKDIAEIFFVSVKDKGILDKIMGITLDNAASNTTFITEFEKLMKNNSLNFDREKQHFCRFAHIINLAMQDSLKRLLIEETFENEINNDEDYESDKTPVLKLRSIFIKLKRSEQLRNKLKSSCDMTNTKYLSPIIDVATRWNSTFDMIECGLSLRLALNTFCSTSDILNIRRFLLTNDEWYLLTQIHLFLKNFKLVSTLLGGDKYATLPLVIVAFNMLLDKIENIKNLLNDKEGKHQTDENLFWAFQVARD